MDDYSFSLIGRTDSLPISLDEDEVEEQEDLGDTRLIQLGLMDC